MSNNILPVSAGRSVSDDSFSVYTCNSASTTYDVVANDDSFFTDSTSGTDDAIVDYEWEKVDWDSDAGTLEGNYDGNMRLFRFTPDTTTDFTGEVTFQYRLEANKDGFCWKSCGTDWTEWATVTITVEPCPVYPVSDEYEMTRYEYTNSGSIRFYPMRNDVCENNDNDELCGDATFILDGSWEGDGVTYLDTDEGGRISVYDTSCQTSLGLVYVDYYPPDGDFAGVDCFSYQIAEGDYYPVATTTCITVMGEEPSAVDDEVYTTTGESVSFDPLDNDTYHDLDDVEIIFSYSGDGTVVSNGDGSFTYAPPSSMDEGTESMEYVISDTWGTSTGTVTFYIDYEFFRVVADDFVDIGFGSTSSVTIDVSENDYNPDATELKWHSGESLSSHISLCVSTWSFDGTVLTIQGSDDTDVGMECKLQYYYDDYSDSKGYIYITVTDV